MTPGETDPLAMILAGGSAAISMLLGFVVALVGARAKHAESRIAELEKQQQLRWVEATAVAGEVRTNKAEIESLKRDALTRELFEERTNSQDRKLDQLENKVERVGRDLVARPTRSEMSFPASRVPQREAPSSEPPPMRPRASSIRRDDK